MKIISDGVKVSGPKVDGSYSITFSIGEYQRDIVAELIKIKPESVIELEINCEDKG